MAKVKLGCLGNIKPLLNDLLKKKDFTDLEFRCHDGVLACHKFIIGSQSTYLKRILLDQSDGLGGGGDLAVISLPGYQTTHLGTVLKFLYTGKLKITASCVGVVKDLLENVLRIDAKITLPATPALNGAQKPHHDQPPPPPNGRKEDEHNGNAPKPLKKRFSDSNEDNRSQDSSSEKSPDNSFSVPEDKEPREVPKYSNSIQQAPLSPPDSLEGEEPQLMDLADETDLENEEPVIHREPNSVQNKINTKHLIEAPKVISKHTGGVQVNGRIPVAPKCVAKRTGGPTKHTKRIKMKEKTREDSRSKILPAQSSCEERNSSIDIDEEDPATKPNGWDAQGNSSLGLGSSGTRKRGRPRKSTDLDNAYLCNANEEDDPSFNPSIVLGEPAAKKLTRSQTGSFSSNPTYIENGDEDELGYDVDTFGPLPPPIPQPPEPGMIIKGGEWVRVERAEKMMANRIQNTISSSHRVRKYNGKPLVNISGVSKPETLTALEEPDGEFPCPYEGCSLVYARERSLNVHISRNHHGNLKASCPECGKLLSSASAISKHLLSHRPRDFWPYFCPLCGRKFQSKGDLPKHFQTKLHIHEVPPVGSKEWIDLCNRGVCAPNIDWKKNIQNNPIPLPAIFPLPSNLPQAEPRPSTSSALISPEEKILKAIAENSARLPPVPQKIQVVSTAVIPTEEVVQTPFGDEKVLTGPPPALTARILEGKREEVNTQKENGNEEGRTQSENKEIKNTPQVESKDEQINTPTESKDHESDSACKIKRPWEVDVQTLSVDEVDDYCLPFVESNSPFSSPEKKTIMKKPDE